MLGATLTVKFSMSDLCRESSCVSKLVLDFNTRFIDGCLWSCLHGRAATFSLFFFPSFPRNAMTGIKTREARLCLCRSDHKHPPTHVSGIFRFVHILSPWVVFGLD